MGWKTVKGGLQSDLKGADLRDSDMAARQIMVGLDSSFNKIRSVEMERFGTDFSEETAWSRAVRLWSERSSGPYSKLRFVRGFKLEELEASRKGLALVFRGGNHCYAVFECEPNVIHEMFKPAFSVIATTETGNWLLRMKLSDFVAQTAGGIK